MLDPISVDFSDTYDNQAQVKSRSLMDQRQQWVKKYNLNLSL